MHLDWITHHRPRFVVIAGGKLAFAQELQESGIEVMYIAPDEDLMRLALEAGVRYVIWRAMKPAAMWAPTPP